MTQREREQTEQGQTPNELDEAFERLIEAVRHFLIKLRERSTDMAAQAALTLALSLTRRHESEIAAIKRRLDALEHHALQDHSRG